VRVLVIGGNRFVGLLATWRLLAGGHRVTLLNRGTRPDPFGDRVTRLTGDRSGPDLARLLAGRAFDGVLDLAAFTGEDGRRLAAALGPRAGHHVMVSTGQVYLVREGCPRPAREEDYDGPVMARPSDPADLWDWEYGMGKRACEDALVEAAGAGLTGTRLRIPMVNGPLDYHRRLEGYLWRLVDGGPVLVPDGGAHRVRHVDGGEVARFLVEQLGNRATFGQAYNLAQQETPTLLELLEALKALLGSAAPLVPVAAERLRAAGLVPAEVSPFSGRWMSFIDPSRAGRELGFRHAPMARTLEASVASFLSHPPPDRPKGYARRADELRLAREAG
jgi:nucleoside-diphosphate-sugar epimerase